MDIGPLRPAEVDEVSAFVADLPLYRRYGYTAAAVARDLRAALEDPRCFVTAGRDDGVRGIVWAIDRGAFARSLYVKLVAVRADGHGRGVGRADRGVRHGLSGIARWASTDTGRAGADLRVRSAWISAWRHFPGGVQPAEPSRSAGGAPAFERAGGFW